MTDNNLNRFFVSIVVPSLLAIVFFVLMIFVLILPSFERSNMEGKKEMISELTHTTLSLLEEYNNEVLEGRLPLDSAQQLAIRRIRQIRYGDESKDYFWIINRQPVMVMHPYRPELIGKDLSEYRDPEGKKLFVEAARIVDAEEEGFIDYMWQWKDDSTRIVPKLSFVRVFDPWDWIVGTGIYLEDVRSEMQILQRRLLRITLLFALLLAAIQGYMIRQSLVIERRRQQAEKKLQLSRQKYKSLVEASTEGTLMIVDRKIIFSNMKFSNLSGFSSDDIGTMDFRELFSLEWQTLEDLFEDPSRSVTMETTLQRKQEVSLEVVISLSRVSHGASEAYIVTVKEITDRERLESEKDLIVGEMKSSLLLLQQSIGPYGSQAPKVSPAATVVEAASLMKRKKAAFLLVHDGKESMGCVTESDINERVIAGNGDMKATVISIMSAPLVSISETATLQEALHLMKLKKISHVALRDGEGQLSAYFGGREVMQFLQNNLSFLTLEIEGAESAEEMKKVYGRLPALIHVLMETGSRMSFIGSTITSLGDAIHRRVVELAIEDSGPAPRKFAFMVMGSQARGEQTLATDQDNAIIYEDATDSEAREDPAVKAYFLTLAERINKDLDTIGYYYCKGDIMAKNPEWTHPLSTWKEKFSLWVNASEPKDILDAGIFFDFRCAYGSIELVDQLRQHVHYLTEHRPVFFYHMAQAVIRFKPPSIPTSSSARSSEVYSSGLNVKKALLPIVTFARLHAFRHNLFDPGTIARLRSSHEKGLLDEKTNEEVSAAFEILMGVRLKNQVQQIMEGQYPANQVLADTLKDTEIATIKDQLGVISTLQSILSLEFKPG